jgi:hypothetical protein
MVALAIRAWSWEGERDFRSIAMDIPMVFLKELRN